MDILISYLVGSIPTAYLFGKLKGIDLHRYGSGNIGATNAWRVMGKGIGIITLIMDIIKGIIVVKIIAPFLSGKTGEGLFLHQLYCGLAVISGHNFPIFLKFRGGKGVATTAGVLLGLAPKLAGILLILWAFIVAISGYVSLGSILAALLLPVLCLLLGYPQKFVWFFLSLGVLIIFQHRANLKRVLRREEKKIFNKKSPKE